MGAATVAATSAVKAAAIAADIKDTGDWSIPYPSLIVNFDVITILKLSICGDNLLLLICIILILMGTQSSPHAHSDKKQTPLYDGPKYQCYILFDI